MTVPYSTPKISSVFVVHKCKKVICRYIQIVPLISRSSPTTDSTYIITHAAICKPSFESESTSEFNSLYTCANVIFVPCGSL